MSNANFQAGRPSYASLENQMAAYDALPRSIREALATAAFDWAAYPIKRRFESGNLSAKDWVKFIRKWDHDQIAKDRKRVWGLRRPAKGKPA